MSIFFSITILILILCGTVVYHIGVYDRGVYIETSEWKKIIRRTVELVIVVVILTLSVIFNCLHGSIYMIAAPIIMLLYMIFHKKANFKAKKIFDFPHTNPGNQFEMYIEYGQNAIILLLFFAVVILFLCLSCIHYAIFILPETIMSESINNYDILIEYLKTNFNQIEKIVYNVSTIITSILCAIITMQLVRHIKNNDYPFYQKKVIEKINRSLYPRNTPM